MLIDTVKVQIAIQEISSFNTIIYLFIAKLENFGSFAALLHIIASKT
jgi:hypothetical protein